MNIFSHSNIIPNFSTLKFFKIFKIKIKNNKKDFGGLYIKKTKMQSTSGDNISSPRSECLSKKFQVSDGNRDGAGNGKKIKIARIDRGTSTTTLKVIMPFNISPSSFVILQKNTLVDQTTSTTSLENFKDVDDVVTSSTIADTISNQIDSEMNANKMVKEEEEANLVQDCSAKETKSLNDLNCMSTCTLEEAKSAKFLRMNLDCSSICILQSCSKSCGDLTKKLKQKSIAKESKNRKFEIPRNISAVASANIFDHDLRAFSENLNNVLPKALFKIRSSDWKIILEGLTDLVRLFRYHADFMKTRLDIICIQLSKAVANRRSKVVVAACQASSELFQCLNGVKQLDKDCEILVKHLLTRSGDPATSFLRADAEIALCYMCETLSPSKIVGYLKQLGVSHKNTRIHTVSARLLLQLLQRVGVEGILALPTTKRNTFIECAAKLLQAPSFKTRQPAKSIFYLFGEHKDMDKLIEAVLTPRVYSNIERTLQAIF